MKWGIDFQCERPRSKHNQLDRGSVNRFLPCFRALSFFKKCVSVHQNELHYWNGQHFFLLMCGGTRNKQMERERDLKVRTSKALTFVEQTEIHMKNYKLYYQFFGHIKFSVLCSHLLVPWDLCNKQYLVGDLSLFLVIWKAQEERTSRFQGEGLSPG